METNIDEINKFKQDINVLIDKCMDMLKQNKSEFNNDIRLLVQQISYFNRMLIIYGSQHSDDDESDFVSDDSDEDYAKIIEDRIYINSKNNLKEGVEKQEKEIRKALLGLDDDFDEFHKFGADSSVDPIIYDDNDQNEDNKNNNHNEDKNNDTSDSSDSSDEDGNFILNNTKKTIKNFMSDSNIELVNENANDDYNEPFIQ